MHPIRPVTALAIENQAGSTPPTPHDPRIQLSTRSLSRRLMRSDRSRRVQWQEDAKCRTTRKGLKFDYASMIADDFGNQCKTEASAGRFGGHEGVEEMGGDIGRHARTIVANADFERQTDGLGRGSRLQSDAGPVSRGDDDLTVYPFLINRFRRILN